MAQSGRRYDDPNVQRIWSDAMAPNAAGTGTHCRNFAPFARKLKSVSFAVHVAGTAAGFVAAVMIGTNTVGVQTLGTNTAGVTTNSAIPAGSRAVAALVHVTTKIIGDNTGVMVPSYEFEMDQGALLTD